MMCFSVPMVGVRMGKMGLIENERMLSKVQKMTFLHVGTGSCMGRNRVAL